MSNINTLNIDATFPLAGKDNSSEGFHNNYSAIISAFTAAKTEIEDLQQNAILKSALDGTTLDNNMQGKEITNAKVKNPAYSAMLSSPSTITVSQGTYHKYALSTNTTITVSSTTWPDSLTYGDVYSKIVVEVAATNSGTNTVQFAVSGSGPVLLTDSSIPGGVFTSTSESSTLWELSSADHGATVFLRKLGGPFV
jgi:hypothetical protein